MLLGSGRGCAVGRGRSIHLAVSVVNGKEGVVRVAYSQIVEFMFPTTPDRVVEVKVGADKPQRLVGVIDEGSRSTVLYHTPLAPFLTSSSIRPGI